MSGSLALLLLLAAPDTKNPMLVARKLLDEFATCVVNTKGYRLRNSLDLPVGAQTMRDQLKVLAVPSCLKFDADIANPLSFKPSLVRGAFYEAMYRKDFGAQPPVESFEGVAPIIYPASDDDQDGEATKYRLAMSVGDCVTRAAPIAARALVLTPVESAAETGAVNALLPAVSKCMDAGRTLTLSKPILRGMTAEALYRLTTAKRTAPHA